MSWITKFLIGFCLFVGATAAMSQARTGVEVGQLSDIEPFAISVLTPAQGKLPADQWQNSSANVLADLMDELVPDGGSPRINDLVARVLLSGGAAPADAATRPDLVQFRLMGGIDFGRFAQISEIISRSPGIHQDAELAAIAVNAFMAEGHASAACALAHELSVARSASFWLQMRAFCLALQGNTAGAELTADLVVAAEHDDPAFLTRINRLTTAPSKPVKLEVNSFLELAMIDAAHDIPVADNLSLKMKMALGERDGPQSLSLLFAAFIEGAVPVNVMANRLLMDAAKRAKSAPIEASHSEADATNAAAEPLLLTPLERDLAKLKQVKAQNGMAQLADLFALGRGAQSSPVRAEALSFLLELDVSFKAWLALQRLVVDETRYLPFDPKFAVHAPAFARAALVVGDAELARKWLQLVESEIGDDLMLETILYANGGQVLVNFDSMKNWMKAPLAARSLLVTDLLALAATGQEIDPALRHWLSTQTPQKTSSCPVEKQTALHLSAQNHAVAETIFRAADLLRDDGFSTLGPRCSMAIISALQTVGLQREAQGAAVEWMFAARREK